jgi:hypothetical protein
MLSDKWEGSRKKNSGNDDENSNLPHNRNISEMCAKQSGERAESEPDRNKLNGNDFSDNKNDK